VTLLKLLHVNVAASYLELAEAKFPDGNVPMPYVSSTAFRPLGLNTGDPAEVAAREHRHKLLELAKAAFPDGNVPMPYLVVPARHLQSDRLPIV
jgi:hypothetical protein